MNYATTAEANTYFGGRLHTESWDDASESDRTKALTMATKAIDKLNFAGYKAVTAQALQFPRGTDAAIPEDVKEATCELALRLLDGIDVDREIENARILENSAGSIKTTYNGSIVQEHVLAGIPSPTAWKLLVPYLRDAQTLSIDRVN
jgi:hypothetical protein